MAAKMSSVKSALTMNVEGLRAGVRQSTKELQSLGKTAVKTSRDVALIANIEKLRFGFGVAKGVYNGLSSSIRGVTSSISGFITEQTSLLKQQISVARQLGITQADFATLGNVAAEAGLQVNELREPLFKIASQIEAAKVGSGNAALAFQDLGINLKEISKLDPFQRLASIAKAFSAIQDVNKQSLILNRLFGETGQKAREFLQLGADGFKKIREATILAGQALNAIGVEQVLRLDAAIRDLQDNLAGLKAQILVAIEPAVSAILKVVTKKLQDPAFRKSILGFFTRVSETVGTFLAALISELTTTMTKLSNIVENLNNIFEPLRWPGYLLNSPTPKGMVVTPGGVQFDPKFDNSPPAAAVKTILQEFVEQLAKLKQEINLEFVKPKQNQDPNAPAKAVEKKVEQAVERFKDVFTVATNAVSGSKPGQLSGAEVGTVEGNRLLLKAFDDGYGEAKEVVLLKKSVKVQEKILAAVGNEQVVNVAGAN